MDNIKILTIILKEKKDDIIDYYYLANESDTKLAGIVSLKMNLFEKLPAEIDDYTLFAINAYLNDEISIVRPCHDPVEVPDCPDICAVLASGTIIHYYIENNKMPEFICSLSDDAVDLIMQSDECIQPLIDSGIISKEEVDEYRQKQLKKCS